MKPHIRDLKLSTTILKLSEYNYFGGFLSAISGLSWYVMLAGISGLKFLNTSYPVDL